MKVLIAGMGLIGGSFALALRDRGIADEILGTDSSGENAAEALRLGLADRIVAFEEGIRRPTSWCWPPPSIRSP